LLLVVAGSATVAQAALHVSFVPASPNNYSHQVRPASAVRLIVVHVTEGTSVSAVKWFQNPRAHVSANYVISREGAITQMVRNRNVAWHSGNPWVNHHSIGIEHEGFVNVNATFTDTEYRDSAELVAGLMRHYLLPIDRRHLIGHNQVPDPFHPGLFGGYAHHTDPGRYWDWRRYLAYVRSYAYGTTPPPLPFDVTTSGPGFGEAVSGTVPWEAVPSGETADHVDFLVDGRLRDTERSEPYLFAGSAWDTTRDTNGRHVLRVRAVAPDGAVAESAVVVFVKNPAIRIRSVIPAEGETVSGAVRIEVRVSGTPLRVEFLVDGVVRDVETAPPYAFGGANGSWDTTQEPPGPHTLTVRAIGPTQKPAASRTIHVVVENQ
jgi:N-acetyl-anhydromuramyl-L-alanine amidase AmpD